ncbi:hypothetical protein C8J57DRAFT_677312 [Mycena rebaudengoi]|nr:hypothetical protein C8J57DRAFT_677312 [Mycena rebaudengoi]
MRKACWVSPLRRRKGGLSLRCCDPALHLRKLGDGQGCGQHHDCQYPLSWIAHPQTHGIHFSRRCGRHACCGRSIQPLSAAPVADSSLLGQFRISYPSLWNLKLLFCSLLVSLLGIGPYLHFSIRQHTSSLPLALTFPVVRVIGGLLCVFPAQLLIQHRIMAIVRQRILFKRINDLLADLRHLRLPSFDKKWKDYRPSEEALAALSDFFKSSPSQLEPFAQVLSAAVGITAHEIDPGKIATELDRHITDPWSATLLRVLLILGFIMTFVGYVGCFTLIQDAKSTASDTYIWLGLEAILSLLRMAIWGMNPTWDDPGGIILTMTTSNHDPLSCIIIRKNDPTPQYFDLTEEKAFWQSMSAYCGFIDPAHIPKIPGFKVWYAWLKLEDAETLCLFLEGPQSLFCATEERREQETDIVFYELGKDAAVKWPFERKLTPAHRLMVNANFRLAVFRHYSFIVSIKFGCPSHAMKMSWTLSSPVIEWVDPAQHPEYTGVIDLESSPDDFVNGPIWKNLQKGMEMALSGNSSAFFIGYTVAAARYISLCGFLGSKKLYQLLVSYFDGHTKKTTQAAPQVSDHTLLEYYDSTWAIYSQGTTYLEFIFTSLNQGWVRNQRNSGYTDIQTIGKLALNCWKINVFDPLLEKLQTAQGGKAVMKIGAHFTAGHLTAEDLQDMYVGRPVNRGSLLHDMGTVTSLFRILIIGRANSGKTTILKNLCRSIEDPEIFGTGGEKIDLSVIEPSERDSHHIERELIFKSNPQFVFHDSPGFESGSVDELEEVKVFIENRMNTALRDHQLHAIWHCLPTDSETPLLEADKQLFEVFAKWKEVRVITVLTKFDVLVSKAFGDLRRSGKSLTGANDDKKEIANDRLHTNFIQPLLAQSRPSCLLPDDMRLDTSNCNVLIEMTLEAARTPSPQTKDIAPTIEDIAPTIEDILQLCPRFRILVVGKSGVGKTSLLMQAFGVDAAKVSHQDYYAGVSDINTEIIWEENPRFVLHDSPGFEPGEIANFEKAKRFLQSRGAQVDLKDRVHAIWLCIQVPFAGGRVFETGDEEFLKLAAESSVPIVVAFTKFDLLISRMESNLTDDELELSDEQIDQLCRQRADEEFNQYCVRPLQRLNRTARFAKTSGAGRSADRTTPTNLIRITQELIERDVQKTAERANARMKISASIQIGMSFFLGYWQSITSSANVPESALEKCVATIHLAITQVWYFNDGDKLLESQWFQDKIKALVQLVVPDNSEVESWFSNLGSIQSLVGLGSVLPTAAPAVADIDLSAMFVKWITATHTKTPEVFRFLMGYIIDLVLVMDQLFVVLLAPQVPPPRLMHQDHLDKALENFKNEYVAKVHLEIRSCANEATFADLRAENVEEKILEIMGQYGAK